MIDELSEASERCYRQLVWERPSFERFFHAATPIAEIAGMRLGSRPASRGGGAGDEAVDAAATAAPPLDSVRAIPWVFAWSQIRLNLPGWYGVGSALRQYRQRHGSRGLDQLRAAYAGWPFFAVTLDTAELSLARTELDVAAGYAALAELDGAPPPEWPIIRDEFERSVAEVGAVTGRGRLLEASSRLRRSIELRNPYVDSLSEIQLRLLRRLRQLPAGSDEAERVRSIVQLTVSGISAGLQTTG
jgi:phosphoenolpyruvate carboxylase